MCAQDPSKWGLRGPGVLGLEDRAAILKKITSETPTQCLCPDGFIEKYIEMLTSVLCTFPSPSNFPPSPPSK